MCGNSDRAWTLLDRGCLGYYHRLLVWFARNCEVYVYPLLGAVDTDPAYLWGPYTVILVPVTTIVVVPALGKHLRFPLTLGVQDSCCEDMKLVKTEGCGLHIAS